MATTNPNKKKVTTKSGSKPTPSKSVNPEKIIKDYDKGVMYNASGNPSKKTTASTKKKITSYNAGPMEGVKQLAGKAVKMNINNLKFGAKAILDTERRMLKNLKAGAEAAVPLLKKGAKALAKKITVKNVSKALNAKSGNNRASVVKNSNFDKFKNSGPKYARGGVAKRMKKYQGDVGGSEVKTTTPVAPKNETTAVRPAATTPTPAPAQRTVATAMQENIAAGMSPGQARRTAMKELGLKKSVDPNKVLDAVTTTGQVVHDVIERRNNANNDSGGGMMTGPGGFQRKGGMVKRKLMKASKGVIVKMNGNQPVQKVAGSKGVRSRVNAAAKASKATRGRTGGTSKAPKTATPKAKMGMIMKGKKC